MNASRAFELLALIGIVGTAAELATERHWESAIQLLPWFALAVAAAALMLVRWGRGRRLAEAMLLGVAMISLIGVFEHVRANVDAGFLDVAYGATWGARSTASRWTIAATGGVGPSPTLAPAILLQVTLCIWFASRTSSPVARVSGVVVPMTPHDPA